MASENVHARTREGAAAFIGLIQTIHALSEADLARYPEAVEAGRDVRDYRKMEAVVRTALNSNLFKTDAAHAQGFLRALIDLLCTVGDGCCPSKGWDPILDTAAAYGETTEVSNG